MTPIANLEWDIGDALERVKSVVRLSLARNPGCEWPVLFPFLPLVRNIVVDTSNWIERRKYFTDDPSIHEHWPNRSAASVDFRFHRTASTMPPKGKKVYTEERDDLLCHAWISSSVHLKMTTHHRRRRNPRRKKLHSPMIRVLSTLPPFPQDPPLSSSIRSNGNEGWLLTRPFWIEEDLTRPARKMFHKVPVVVSNLSHLSLLVGRKARLFSWSMIIS